jgi:hypothetical protein
LTAKSAKDFAKSAKEIPGPKGKLSHHGRLLVSAPIILLLLAGHAQHPARRAKVIAAHRNLLCESN